MSRSAVRDARMPPSGDSKCPRDGATLEKRPMRDAVVDVCGACDGAFFEDGATAAAAGVAGDPSSWDRPETEAGVVAGALRCPRCNRVMQVQRVAHDASRVAIDRCGGCGGIWLDRDELAALVAIGEAMRPVIEKEHAMAQAELGRLGKVDLRKGQGAKLGIAAGIAAILGVLTWLLVAYYTRPPPPPEDDGRGTKAKGEEGCPCGCDRSARMAAELRERANDAATQAIAKSLVTIRERENVGYVTERMIEHRLRLIDLADEMHLDLGPVMPPATRERCRVVPSEDTTLRVCADLVVHGERTEIVQGEPKLIASCFRLWLEIEDLGGRERAIAMPSIESAAARFPISRWYREGTTGQRWDGVLRANERARINAIGYVPEHVAPGTEIDARIAVDAIAIAATSIARAVIHFE